MVTKYYFDKGFLDLISLQANARDCFLFGFRIQIKYWKGFFVWLDSDIESTIPNSSKIKLLLNFVLIRDSTIWKLDVNLLDVIYASNKQLMIQFSIPDSHANGNWRHIFQGYPIINHHDYWYQYIWTNFFFRIGR